MAKILFPKGGRYRGVPLYLNFKEIGGAKKKEVLTPLNRVIHYGEF